MKLYAYWRSTSSYRLRIALALKELKPEIVPVHLVRNGGEHLTAFYRSINLQGRVPSLALENGEIIVQSPAIIEYLEEQYPSPALLPMDRLARARVRAVAAIIGCDIHPLHNQSPLNYLRRNIGLDDEAILAWIGKWIGDGLGAVEELIGSSGYAFGDTPGLADVYLIPQLYAARRFKLDFERYPKLARVDALASTHPAFISAHPSRQPDAEETAP